MKLSKPTAFGSAFRAKLRGKRTVVGWLVPFAFVLALAGCNKGDHLTAPVSGVVTLNGKPLAGARVYLQPRGIGKDHIAGPGSVGTTDASGRYWQETIRGVEGAVVGEHEVAIRTAGEKTESDGRITKIKEVLPPEYNVRTTLSLIVPAEGTESANFDLVTKAPQR